MGEGLRLLLKGGGGGGGSEDVVVIEGLWVTFEGLGYI